MYKRQLPVCAVNEDLSIAAFIMFGDVEITDQCAKALLQKCPAHDVISVSYTHLDVYKRQAQPAAAGGSEQDNGFSAKIIAL